MLSISDEMRNNKAYNGNTYKFGVRILERDYIVKFPKGDDLSVYCEYIASGFISRVGYQCQEVKLGSYRNTVVDVIADFTSGTDLMLHSFRDTKQSSEDTDIGDKEYTYQDVVYLIEKHLKLGANEKEEAKHRFWQMFLCDAILANRDRHWGNWGYLSDGSRYYAAPIYDNGACLFPGIRHAVHSFEADPKAFLYDRVFVFPASLFMVKRKSRENPDVVRAHRTNYYDILGNTGVDPVFLDETEKLCKTWTVHALYHMMRRLVMEDKDLEHVPVEESVRKFWLCIVPLRYACIVRRESFDAAFARLQAWLKEDGYV